MWHCYSLQDPGPCPHNHLNSKMWGWSGPAPLNETLRPPQQHSGPVLREQEFSRRETPYDWTSNNKRKQDMLRTHTTSAPCGWILARVSFSFNWTEQEEVQRRRWSSADTALQTPPHSGWLISFRCGGFSLGARGSVSCTTVSILWVSTNMTKSCIYRSYGVNL